MTSLDPFGYSHYTGLPVDDQHTYKLVPQSMMDGWECFCSCGKWREFASFYDYDTKEDLLGYLWLAHQEHIKSIS